MVTTDRLEDLPKRLVITFAADCEQAYADDPRPREAIAAARDWLEKGPRRSASSAPAWVPSRPAAIRLATMPSRAHQGG